MSVAGIFKEVTTISLSAVVFGDTLNELNILGVGITIIGWSTTKSKALELSPWIITNITWHQALHSSRTTSTVNQSTPRHLPLHGPFGSDPSIATKRYVSSSRSTLNLISTWHTSVSIYVALKPAPSPIRDGNPNDEPASRSLSSAI